jgi:hypothetical protein
MNIWKCVATGIAGVAIASFADAAAITPGNLVVVRAGDGSAALTSNATAAFLTEYTAAAANQAAPVQTIALPTATAGSNRALTLSGTSTSEGFLTLSSNGQYLTLGGYNAAPGTASVTSATASTVNRVLGRVTLGGAIDSSTALADATNLGNIRSVVSNDGTGFWAGTSAGGARYQSFGTVGTSTQLSTSVTNTRAVNIAGGQLYSSNASGTFQGVSSIGTGLPTTSGQTTTILPGFPTTAGPSPYDYMFAGTSTLYVADDRTNGNGGIQKWTLSGGTWSLQYTLAVTATSGTRGLAGYVDGSGNAVLFATTTETSANKLVTVTDLGNTSSFTTLATAPTNTAFRGVDFVPVPEPTTVAMIALAGFALTRRRRSR